MTEKPQWHSFWQMQVIPATITMRTFSFQIFKSGYEEVFLSIWISKMEVTKVLVLRHAKLFVQKGRFRKLRYHPWAQGMKACYRQARELIECVLCKVYPWLKGTKKHCPVVPSASNFFMKLGILHHIVKLYGNYWRLSFNCKKLPSFEII